MVPHCDCHFYAPWCCPSVASWARSTLNAISGALTGPACTTVGTLLGSKANECKKWAEEMQGRNPSNNFGNFAGMLFAASLTRQPSLLLQYKKTAISSAVPKDYAEWQKKNSTDTYEASELASALMADTVVSKATSRGDRIRGVSPYVLNEAFTAKKIADKWGSHFVEAGNMANAQASTFQALLVAGSPGPGTVDNEYIPNRANAMLLDAQFSGPYFAGSYLDVSRVGDLKLAERWEQARKTFPGLPAMPSKEARIAVLTLRQGTGGQGQTVATPRIPYALDGSRAHLFLWYEESEKNALLAASYLPSQLGGGGGDGGGTPGPGPNVGQVEQSGPSTGVLVAAGLGAVLLVGGGVYYLSKKRRS